MSDLPDPLVPTLPPQVPQSRKGFSRLLGTAWLRMTGWRLTGEFPNVPKAVIVVAPHSSNWDGFHGLAMRQVVGIDVSILGKKQLFWWPLGPVLRAAGVVPIDRGADGGGLIEQAVDQFRRHDRFWLGVAPEGTRKTVDRWKSGFWRIARAANVPIVTAHFHYPEKRAGIGPMFHTTDDMDADIARIRAAYVDWRGYAGKSAV